MKLDRNNFASWPAHSNDELLAVQNVLKSGKTNYWTGLECKNFEVEFASYCKSKYAIAVSNGTVALELAISSIGISPGDEIIVTARSFFASASAIVNSGAVPIFADVDPDTQNITAETIAPLITSRTRAVLCVHLAGFPCDLDPILSLVKNKNIYVVEDCAQAHGAMYKGRPVGGIGDVGCWSFCQDKIMSTGGEGGMITTNSTDLWTKMWSLKDHGKSYEKVNEIHNGSEFRWLHDTFGTNGRMTEMQAVIGRMQLNKLERWNKIRNQNCSAIWSAAASCSTLRVPKLSCDGCNVEFCDASASCRNAAYKCYVFVRAGASTRDRFLHEIRARGVPCSTGSCPEIYLEQAFTRSNKALQTRLPISKKLGETSLMFLCHPTLTKANIDLTCSVLNDVCS
ncbi:DegT/DnrJ/EryC1/StrS family aminotransferase [Roseobacter sp. HKCCD5988]|uniref:DegT/DnrJ/EryC1/StrS family aminotransferase n=1 Tax=Roseobacter sp. HKCCD5988 TaxID=3120338 RepID=UPI0030ECC3CF